MYYTYISLYLLVMPHLPVPHIVLAFLCSSKRPWGLLEAQYIPPMPLIIVFCRRPNGCSCWEGVLPNRPLFSIFFFILATLAVVRPIGPCARQEEPCSISVPLVILGISLSLVFSVMRSEEHP